MNRYVRSITLLNAVGIDTVSDIVPISDFEAPTLEVDGLNGSDDTLTVQGSMKAFNQEVLPADMKPVGTVITADGIYKIDPDMIWANVELDLVSGSGPVTAILGGQCQT
jgi:hypothetical protein